MEEANSTLLEITIFYWLLRVTLSCWHVKLFSFPTC